MVCSDLSIWIGGLVVGDCGGGSSGECWEAEESDGGGGSGTASFGKDIVCVSESALDCAWVFLLTLVPRETLALSVVTE